MEAAKCSNIVRAAQFLCIYFGTTLLADAAVFWKIFVVLFGRLMNKCFLSAVKMFNIPNQ